MFSRFYGIICSPVDSLKKDRVILLCHIIVIISCRWKIFACGILFINVTLIWLLCHQSF